MASARRTGLGTGRGWRAGRGDARALHLARQSPALHIWPDFFASLTGSGRPLFRSPVLDDPAAAGCSRFAAYRAFTQAYGIPPSDYQRQLRVRAARRLLSQGGSPALVAAQAGFADQAHLTRWFRRYYGGTPGAYRGAACPEGS